MLMKKLIPLFSLIGMMFVSCGGSETTIEKPYNQGINITPIPLELIQKEDTFRLSKNVSFVVNDEAAEKVTAYFAAKIKNSTGYELKTVKEKPTSDYISFTIVKDIPVNEGYLLDITQQSIDIQAKTP